jgi:hypothetical protein
MIVLSRHLFVCLTFLLALSACGGVDTKYSSDAEVSTKSYISDQPTSVTLLTVVRNSNGAGAHSGILINGSQRVMYDPAGSWTHPALPQRGDVFFGMTDKMVAFYIDYHARETFRVIEQTVPVSQATADRMIQLALGTPAAAKSTCTQKTSALLRSVPGFESVPSTWFPLAASKGFATLPGVTSRTITDDDDDENHGVLIVQMGDPRLE